jgi:hypothetical protein
VCGIVYIVSVLGSLNENGNVDGGSSYSWRLREKTNT